MVWRHHGKDRKLDTQERENMSKLLIALPCTAQELENALHAVCDHHGLWDAKVYADIIDERLVLEVKTDTSSIPHQ